jgi:hypothetical protein
MRSLTLAFTLFAALGTGCAWVGSGQGLTVYDHPRALTSESQAFVRDVAAHWPDSQGLTDHTVFLLMLTESDDPVDQGVIREILPLADRHRRAGFSLMELQRDRADLGAPQWAFLSDLFAPMSLEEMSTPTGLVFDVHGNVLAHCEWSESGRGPSVRRVEQVITQALETN